MPALTSETCIRKSVNVELLQNLQKLLDQRSDLDGLATMLSIAGNETRLKILYLLKEAPEMCVCDIADVTDMTVSSISHQLSKLRAYNLVQKRREGQTIYYRLTDTSFIEFLKRLLELDD